jgi:hypothetical protein
MAPTLRKFKFQPRSMIKRYSISILTILVLHVHSLAQGKWTLGLEATRRIELRKYEDSYRYLLKRGGFESVFPVGVNVAYQYSEKWRFESGLLSTPYSRTVAVFYNEPGYQRLFNRPLFFINPTSTFEIPLKVAYHPGFRWKRIQFNVIGGLNTYILDGVLDSMGEAGLPSVPVLPTPPTNLSVIYNMRPISRINFSLETGAEAMRELGRRFIVLYRFSARLGLIDMVEMEGNYKTGQNILENPENIYPFRIVSNGTALHHTFSLRYRLGKKKEKENWWENGD